MKIRGQAVHRFDWLTATPIAHRGLHDAASGQFENSLSAGRAAAEAGLAIECDVQRTRDGEAVVFHDFTLDRLTRSAGRVADQTAAALSQLCLGSSADHIVSLAAFLATIDGRVPVVCEIKSAFDGDLRLADRVAEVGGGYAGRLALKSFDPAVVAHLRQGLPDDGRWPLGIVAEAHYDDPEWQFLSAAQKKELAALTHFNETRPDFLSYHVNDLPHAAVTLFRLVCAGPVVSWTVRTPAQRSLVEDWADQMVFEGFRP